MPKNLSKQRKNEKQRKSVCPLHFTDFKWPVFCSQMSKMGSPVPNDIGDMLRTHRTTYHTYMSLVTYAQKPLKTPKNTEKPIFTKRNRGTVTHCTKGIYTNRCNFFSFQYFFIKSSDPESPELDGKVIPWCGFHFWDSHDGHFHIQKKNTPPPPRFAP